MEYVKSHKDPISIRPMVDKVSSPLYKLERAIAKWTVPHLQPYKYTVSSSLDFLDKFLQLGPFLNESYSILDYESLYPSIKLAPAALMLYHFIMQHLPESECSSPMIRNICHLITYNSYFMFHNQYYLQTTGVPIGNPLAGIMAELIVRHKETMVLATFRSEIKLYLRYVDDVCIVWNHTHYEQALVDSMHDDSLGLKLKIEQSSYSSFHFLDILVNTEYGEYITNIYRKLTYCPILIPS